MSHHLSYRVNDDVNAIDEGLANIVRGDFLQTGGMGDRICTFNPQAFGGAMRQYVAQFNLEMLGGLGANFKMVFLSQGRDNRLVHRLTALRQRFVTDQPAH